MPDQQHCRKCDTLKELNAENFYRDASNKTGFAKNWCKKCTKKYNNGRRAQRSIKAGLSTTHLNEINEEPSEKRKAFDDVCFKEQVRKRSTGTLSIYKPIAQAIPLTNAPKTRTIKVLS